MGSETRGIERKCHHQKLSLFTADVIRRELAKTRIGENRIELIRRQSKCTKISSFPLYQQEPAEDKKETKDCLWNSYKKRR